MGRKKYLDYKESGGKWYGLIDYVGVKPVWERVKSPPKSYFSGDSGKRAYSVGKGHAGIVSIPDKYKSAFPKDMLTSKTRGGLRISKEYLKPYKGKGFGKTNPFSPLNIKIEGAKKRFAQSQTQRYNKSGTKGVVGLDFRWLKQHLIGVIEKLEINAMNYTVILSLRAQKIFQDSFRYKKFYSANGATWQALDKDTIKKRLRKHTWPGAGGMLREYGNMFNSIKVRRTEKNIFRGGVYTDISEYKKYIYKNGQEREPFCYAGIHNEGGRIRYGRKLPKRQFIGHSTYLFDFALQQADRYLFFNVFD